MDKEKVSPRGRGGGKRGNTMKKRVLSILLCLCMVLMLCPAAAFADENYTITQNFKYGTRTYDGTDRQTSPYQFVIPAGGSFGLATIEDCAPYELVGWQESVSGTVYAPYAEIQNLQSDLTFDAVYQVQGGLAITVNGFMPGKTPNDCEYTFESTIPGIAFSADDVRGIDWFKLAPGEIGSQWFPVDKDEAFQTGTYYEVVIVLNNNGLKLAPSTTVNGIAPVSCKIGQYSNGVPYKLSIYCELGTPVAPTLAVTVDNFEVGKTPNDITYSFASTNLGVTFSETDIQDIQWFKYTFVEEGFDWYEMVDTDVFQADTRYWCSIKLDNKGLDTAPAVTVNGKTPEYCGIATKDGVPIQLRMECILNTPAPAAITISGPDVVCAEQDYEFSATVSEGAEVSYSRYQCGEYGADMGWSRIEDGVCYGTVPASEYGDADSMVLTVYGTAANGKPATATKTVQILKEHIFVDGVCTCGAKPEYTIEYVCGIAENSIPSGVKADGVDFTLSSETFIWNGYVQTGWRDEYSTEYELGGTYTLDKDMTFYPIFEKLITVTADFTTTVALGDAGEPGETAFWLGLIDGAGNELTYDNQYFFAEITTNGAGDYSGTMTITATGDWLYDMLYEGAFIWQYDDEEEGWTYDDTVWGVRLYMPEVEARSVDTAQYSLLIYPACVADNGSFDLDLNAGPVDKMSFTNTYTDHVYELKHDATHHWDECACKDVQNKELHKYGDWKVTKEATQTAKGEKEHTCTVCGYTEKTEIPVRTNVPSGDDSSFALWAALFTLSAAAVITTATVSKKKKASK